jgi:hypothetical protein
LRNTNPTKNRGWTQMLHTWHISKVRQDLASLYLRLRKLWYVNAIVYWCYLWCKNFVP